MATETMTRAAQDMLAERQRQVEVEGWTPRHDDEHTDESLATVAAIYALPPEKRERNIRSVWHSRVWTYLWPASWHERYWKPSPDNRRSELVKAGALILAEIERLDRAEARHA